MELLIRYANCSAEGAELLTKLVTQAGTPMYKRADAAGRRPGGVVCYGRSYPGDLPALNARVNRFNKCEQLRLHAQAGCRTVPMFRAPELGTYPAFARQYSHIGGNELKLVANKAEAAHALDNGYEFFTTFVPSEREYRAWVFGDKVIASHVKQLTRPQLQQPHIRTYDTGWELMPLDYTPRGIAKHAVPAVESLGLQFGAVDLLLGDGKWWVLEVNSAPGFSLVGHRALAQEIHTWERGL